MTNWVVETKELLEGWRWHEDAPPYGTDEWRKWIIAKNRRERLHDEFSQLAQEADDVDA